MHSNIHTCPWVLEYCIAGHVNTPLCTPAPSIRLSTSCRQLSVLLNPKHSAVGPGPPAHTHAHNARSTAPCPPHAWVIKAVYLAVCSGPVKAIAHSLQVMVPALVVVVVCVGCACGHYCMCMPLCVCTLVCVCLRVQPHEHMCVGGIAGVSTRMQHRRGYNIGQAAPALMLLLHTAAATMHRPSHTTATALACRTNAHIARFRSLSGMLDASHLLTENMEFATFCKAPAVVPTILHPLHLLLVLLFMSLDTSQPPRSALAAAHSTSSPV